MASRQAIVMAYKLISANAPLVKAPDNESLMILIRSWEIAFKSIDDITLGYGVERLLSEISEINRSTVVSAKILELCKPKEKPFNEYIVTEAINKLMDSYVSPDKWKKAKAEIDPLLFKLIEDYPFVAIREASTEMLPAIYSQLRNDYKLRYQAQKIEEHNRKLEQLESEKKDILMLEVAG
jgi:hypothetical protein